MFPLKVSLAWSDLAFLVLINALKTTVRIQVEFFMLKPPKYSISCSLGSRLRQSM